MKVLSNLYKSMQEKELGDNADLVHAAYYSLFTNFSGSYQITAFWDRFVPRMGKPLNVLIVGAYGGRDYYHFLLKGDKLSVIDLCDYPEFPGIRIGNIETDRLFDLYSFDVVVLAEVLEHLIYDYDALMNIRHMLKDNGLLLISLPYYNDKERTHVRVHSRISIARLLAAAGFEIINYRERPGLIKFGRIYMMLIHFLNLLCYVILKRTYYGLLFRLTSIVDTAMSRYRIPWRRFSSQYGAQMACRKTNQQSIYSDIVSFNRDLFRSRTARDG